MLCRRLMTENITDPYCVKYASAYVALMPIGGIIEVWKVRLNFEMKSFERTLKLSRPLNDVNLSIVFQHPLNKTEI